MNYIYQQLVTHDRAQLISMLILKKARLHSWLALMIYRITLDIVFIFSVSPAFKDHFLFPMVFEANVIYYIYSLLLFFCFCLFIKGDLNNIYDLFNITAIIFYIGPLTAVYGLNSSLTAMPVLATLLAYVLINFTIQTKMSISAQFKIKSLSIPQFYIFLWLLIFLFLAWSIISGAIQYVNFDLRSTLYSSRDKLSSLMDIGIMTYLNIWITKVIAVILLGLAMQRKKLLHVFIMLGFFAFAFSVTSHRTVLFLPILVFMIYYVYSSGFTLYQLILMLSGFILLVFFGIKYFDLDILSAIIFRRALFVSPAATYVWWDYFTNHDFVVWSDRFLSSVYTSVYNGKNLAYFVGDEVTNGKYNAVGLNVGLIASGYANLGWGGIFIYAAILSFVIKLLALVSKSIVPVWFLAIVFVNPIRTIWTSTDIFTGMLTHGVLVGLIILIITPNKLFSYKKIILMKG